MAASTECVPWRKFRLCGAFLLIAGLCGVVAGSRAWAQEKKDLPKGEELLDRVVDAMGGKDAFQRLRTRVQKGTFEVLGQNIKGPITVYEVAPDKQYTLVEGGESIGRIESGTDGTVYWEMSVMSGPRILEGEEKALSERQTTFNAALYWRKLYKKAECVGSEDVDGRPCFKVEMTPNEGAVETAYIDQKTDLLVKAAMKMKSPRGEIPLEFLYADYKKFDGILIPLKTTLRVMSMDQVVTIDSVEHNVDIPADRVALPAPVKALAAKGTPESKPATRAAEEPKKEEPKKDKP